MSAHSKPSARQIQPMGFRGRLDAIRAPMTGKTEKDMKSATSPMVLAPRLLGTWEDRARTNSATVATTMVSVRPARAHASQLAVRALIVWHFLSQHHSTGLPSSKRYGNRYEEKGQERYSETLPSRKLTVLPRKTSRTGGARRSHRG